MLLGVLFFAACIFSVAPCIVQCVGGIECVVMEHNACLVFTSAGNQIWQPGSCYRQMSVTVLRRNAKTRPEPSVPLAVTDRQKHNRYSYLDVLYPSMIRAVGQTETTEVGKHIRQLLNIHHIETFYDVSLPLCHGLF